MLLYLVSEGDYEDYQVRGIFSTRNKAEESKTKIISDSGFDDVRIEEFELDKECKGDKENVTHYF